MKVSSILFTCFTFWAQVVAAQSNDQIIDQFQRYIDLYNTSVPSNASDREKFTQDLKVSKDQLLGAGGAGVEVLLEQLSNPRSGIYKQDILQFFIDSPSLNHDIILPAVRDLIKAQEVDESYPAIIVNCMGYLGKHGTLNDIELIERFSENTVPGVKQSVTSVRIAIERREKLDNADNERPEKPSAAPNQKVVKEKQANILEDVAQKESRPTLAILALIALGVIGVGMVFVLLKGK